MDLSGDSPFYVLIDEKERLKAEGSQRENPLVFVPLCWPFKMGSSALWQVCEVDILLEVIAISLLWVIVCPYAQQDHYRKRILDCYRSRASDQGSAILSFSRE